MRISMFRVSRSTNELSSPFQAETKLCTILFKSALTWLGGKYLRSCNLKLPKKIFEVQKVRRRRLSFGFQKTFVQMSFVKIVADLSKCHFLLLRIVELSRLQRKFGPPSVFFLFQNLEYEQNFTPLSPRLVNFTTLTLTAIGALNQTRCGFPRISNGTPCQS